jgi:hypothetical protein
LVFAFFAYQTVSFVVVFFRFSALVGQVLPNAAVNTSVSHGRNLIFPRRAHETVSQLVVRASVSAVVR